MLKSNLDCGYNFGVQCDRERSCKKCGWYPEENKRRVAKIRDKFTKHKIVVAIPTDKREPV